MVPSNILFKPLSVTIIPVIFIGIPLHHHKLNFSIYVQFAREMSGGALYRPDGTFSKPGGAHN